MTTYKKICWIGSAVFLAAAVLAINRGALLRLVDPVFAGKSPNSINFTSKSSDPSIRMLISVVWEGDHLSQNNLEAIQSLKGKFGAKNILHFVNPAYFLRSESESAIELVKGVIKPDDLLGLSVYSWKSWVTESGARFRSSPTFWGKPVSPSDCEVDCGKEVLFSSYPKMEQVKILSSGLKILDSNFDNSILGVSYVAGWHVDTDLAASLVQSGIKEDYSAVPHRLVELSIAPFPLFAWIQKLWPEESTIRTGFSFGRGKGVIRELGNSAASLDYHDAGTLLLLADDFIAQAKEDASMDPLFHLVIHQETAAETIPRLHATWPQIELRAREAGVRLESWTPSLKPLAQK